MAQRNMKEDLQEMGRIVILIRERNMRKMLDLMFQSRDTEVRRVRKLSKALMVLQMITTTPKTHHQSSRSHQDFLKSVIHYFLSV